jgi:hypothetical protein
VSYRDDTNALYARAEALERDLERARAELAELRGQARPRGTDDEFPAGEQLSSGSPFSPTPESLSVKAARAQAASDRALAALELREGAAEAPWLGAVHQYEDALGRAVELVIPDLIARHRGVSGDGSPEQLQWMLDVLVATLREQFSGGPPVGAKPWKTIASLVDGWAPHNELGRVLAALGAYWGR